MGYSPLNEANGTSAANGKAGGAAFNFMGNTQPSWTTRRGATGTNALAADEPNGSNFDWTFQSGVAGDSAFNFLANGETLELTYNVLVTDSSGAASGESTTDTSTVVVTITGTNDTPDITFADLTGAVTEDANTSAAGGLADQVNTLTLSGSYATDDTVTATVNNVDITYTVQDADNTLALVATGLANAINNSPNLVDVITASATDDVH